MHRPSNIVVVDDEAAVRQVLRELFEREYFFVFEAESKQQLMSVMESVDIDLVTLDLSLATENGLDILRDLRSQSDVGIILVSGKDELIDKVTGLELGADDYISKPFLLREVLARVRSVLRRRAVSSGQGGETATSAPAANREPMEFVFRSWTLSQARRDLRQENDETLDLTTNEYKLLELFVANPNRVLSRDQIMDRLRGVEWSPTDRSIDNYIARLRRKIDADDQPSLIKTVRGVGYQFTAGVTKKQHLLQWQ